MNNEKYETTDLDTAVALLTSGVCLLEVKGISYKRFAFVFPKTEDTNRILQKLLDQSLTLPVHSLFANARFLKSKIYQMS